MSPMSDKQTIKLLYHPQNAPKQIIVFPETVREIYLKVFFHIQIKTAKFLQKGKFPG